MTDFDTIREALRNATTEAEVEQVADQYRGVLRAMHEVDKARALIIVNLKAKRLQDIKAGFG